MPKSKEAHGSRYHYCSPNTDLLGWIIEKVTGTSFGNYFSKEIFQKCSPQYNAFITLDDENSPRTAGGICMVIAHIVQNGIKQALRINKYMLVEFMAKKFGLTLLMKFQLLCSHQENSP